MTVSPFLFYFSTQEISMPWEMKLSEANMKSYNYDFNKIFCLSISSNNKNKFVNIITMYEYP